MDVNVSRQQHLPTHQQEICPENALKVVYPFQVIGVDFAGPIHHRHTAKSEGKAYIILYTYSLTCALYLEVLPDMTCEEFLGSFKKMIANRIEVVLRK